MRALPKKFYRLTNDAKSARQWRDAKQQVLEAAVETTKSELTGLGAFVGFGSAIISIILLLDCLIVAAPANNHGEFTWPSFGNWTFLIGGMGIVIGIGLGLAGSNATANLRDRTRRQRETELKGNALFVRAERICRAVKDFAVHCDRYQAWRQQVDEELMEEDTEATTRYRTFLERAHETLTAAIENFTVVAERVRREEAYVAAHPELNAGDSGTSLTLLLEELKADVVKPELPVAIADPTQALAHEEALRDVMHDLAAEQPGTT